MTKRFERSFGKLTQSSENQLGVRKKNIGYVASVSWPRSGHHLLQRILSAYFGKVFGYCEYYHPEDCCKTFPCLRAGQINLSKNHDFQLDLPQLDHIRYVIQYRDFICSVVSYFELHLKFENAPDTAEEFAKFASKQWMNYQKFVMKWVHSDFAKSKLVINYDRLVAEPLTVMREVIVLLAPNDDPDEARLGEVIGNIGQITFYGMGDVHVGYGVEATRDLKAFRHFDPEVFSLLSRLVLSREQVVKSCKEFLGSVPGEIEVLELQCSENLHELRSRLSSSQQSYT